MDLSNKKIKEFISEHGIECDLKDLSIDSEDNLCLFIDPNKIISSITEISEKKLKKFEQKVKEKFELESFTIVLNKQSYKRTTPLDSYYSLSDIAILRVIKNRFPVEKDQIIRDLKEKEFKFSIEQIKRRLDRIREKGLIFYDNKKYFLTEMGLEVLPTQKNKNSSDIERVLELGKRKW